VPGVQESGQAASKVLSGAEKAKKLQRDESMRFEKFERIRCFIGGKKEGKTLIFNKYKGDNTIYIILREPTRESQLPVGKTMQLGRNHQPDWFTERDDTISGTHLTIKNENGALIITSHNRHGATTVEHLF
jgi:hypothetical protein